MNFFNSSRLMKHVLVLSAFSFTAGGVIMGCQSAIDKAKRQASYSAYEMVGIEKRELLKDRVDDARDEQKEAGKSFESALQRLKSLYGFKGGKLERQYNSLQSAYDDANEEAQDVRESIRKVETVAEDLFAEWNKEIEEIETTSLKSRSRKTLADTRTRYMQLHANLKASEEKMEPVLRKFHDQVLYLKHNLNAQAIASLKGEASTIEKDIERLIEDMKKSTASAEEFIKQMPD